MLKISTFSKGGVHPPGKKSLSSAMPIVDLQYRGPFIVPASQHLGVPASILVTKGETVTKGQKICEANGFISAHVHSPVNGEVTDIKTLFLPSGVKTQAVVITPNDTEEDLDFQEMDYSNLSPSEMVSIIKEFGLVGLGGATFPAHVKFAIPKGKKAEYLVINGVECEPYLTADHRLMLEKADKIIAGIQIAAKMIQVKKCIIGIEANKPDALELLDKKVSELQTDLSISVMPLKLKYPQGDEKQLLKATINREVPSGGLPLDIGAVVANVGTIHAIYEAIALQKPLYERIVTVTGEAVKSPGNFRVKIGTPLQVLIDACGGFSQQPQKLVAGGPMMGFSFYDLETPVIKGTSGILALTADTVNYAEETPCISCGRCVQACPMGLQPTKLYKNISIGEYATAAKLSLQDCKECGCCSFVCPAKIPLVQGMRTGKRMLRKVK